MGWNDRNPELYDSMVDEGIIAGPKYFEPAPRTMPAGWEPPPMPETCESCDAKGDALDGHTGVCVECAEGCCVKCSTYDDDIDGRTFWCSDCNEGNL